MVDEMPGVNVEVPYLGQIADVVNRHGRRVVDTSGVPPLPSINDELEVVSSLVGLGRYIEINVRIAYETITGNRPSGDYVSVRRELPKHLGGVNAGQIEGVLEVAAIGADGIAHGDFATVDHAIRRAKREFPKLFVREYPQVQLYRAVIRKHGLNVTVNQDKATATALDEQGRPIPLERVGPNKSSPWVANMQAFYQVGAFVNLFEILSEAIRYAVVLRELASAERAKGAAALNAAAPGPSDQSDQS